MTSLSASWFGHLMQCYSLCFKRQMSYSFIQQLLIIISCLSFIILMMHVNLVQFVHLHNSSYLNLSSRLILNDSSSTYWTCIIHWNIDGTMQDLEQIVIIWMCNCLICNMCSVQFMLILYWIDCSIIYLSIKWQSLFAGDLILHKYWAFVCVQQYAVWFTDKVQMWWQRNMVWTKSR